MLDSRSSWSITTDAMFTPQSSPSLSVLVRTIALPLDVTATLTETAEPTAVGRWIRSAINGKDAISGIAYLANQAYRPGNAVGPTLANQLANEFLDEVLESLQIPTFGSPPKGWTSLGAALSSGGLTSAYVVTSGDHSATVVFIGAGLTLLMTVLAPSAVALGQGLAGRIEHALRIDDGRKTSDQTQPKDAGPKKAKKKAKKKAGSKTAAKAAPKKAAKKVAEKVKA